jgi:protein-disulfide isomerase
VAHSASRPVSYPKKRRAAKGTSSRTRLLLAVNAAAALVVSVLVIASQLGGGGGGTDGASGQLMGSTDGAALLAGIPQHGTVLGSSNAPVTLVEFADLQCPYCAQFSRDALPSLIADYVRTGKVRLVFHGLAFVGPESDTALRASLAAGHQNRLWNALHLFYANQGAENSGWVTDGFIRSLAGGIAGVDVARLLTDAQSPGVNSTPSFRVGRTGGTLTQLDVHSLDAAAFRPTLDQLLEG